MSTKGRKPIPKTQKEISNGFVDPYDTTRGNPNNVQGLNRGEKVSLKGDTVKPFSIGIKDIDESIMFYFKNVIKPFVIQNGQRLAVPIMYGAPERWKSVQRDGFMRDQKGKIMAPMIMFKRNNITPLRNVTNKLDANRPINFEYFQSKYSRNNFYDKFNILNNRQPVKQNYAVVVPEFMEITYSCMMYTYYVEQLNKIIEAVQYAQNSYWGDPERFKFKATIDSFATVTELSEGSERTVRANFDLKLYGHIIPDTIQKDLTVDKKVFSKARIVTSTETVVNLNELTTSQINQPVNVVNLDTPVDSGDRNTPSRPIYQINSLLTEAENLITTEDGVTITTELQTPSLVNPHFSLLTQAGNLITTEDNITLTTEPQL